MMNATINDETWIEYFTVELRMRRVPGPVIGDAVASVRELLADSGESAEEAFGTPREYAASLDLAADAPREHALRVLVEPIIGLFAFLAFTLACPPFFTGEQVLLSVPQVLLLGIPLLIVVLFVFPPYVRLLTRNRWMPILPMLVGGVAGALASLFTPDTADEAWLVFPPVIVLVVTGAVLVIISIVSTVQNLRRRDSDAIVDPLRGDTTPGWARTGYAVAVGWIFPAFALLAFGFFWLMSVLGA